MKYSFGTSPSSGAIPTRARAAGGFTLIELLTVIAIVALLVALVGGAGIAVIRKRQEAVTQSVLNSLDRALDEYITINGAPPAYRAQDWDRVPGNGYRFDSFPDYKGQKHPNRPDASVFIRKAQGTGEIDSIIRGIGEDFLVTTPNEDSGQIDQSNPNDTLDPSVIDFWGLDVWSNDLDTDSKWGITQQQLVYYVHPDNTLAQELYGQCVNRRPYFMSAGRDQRYGLGGEQTGSAKKIVEAWLDDNLYSYDVGPANLSDDFWSSHRMEY